jgi:aspartate dehydrogenase
VTPRIVLLGLGAINTRVVELLQSRQSNAVIAGIIVRNPQALSGVSNEIQRITNPSELQACAPDLVVEAASAEAVRQWGEAALRSARRMLVTSASAFADEQLLASLRETARRSSSQLVLSPGAIAGVDALAAAARAGLHEVRHRIVKHPDRWGHAEARDVASASEYLVFRGSAREAARRYPLNANVTIVSALSGLGLDATTVELVADRTATLNRHEIRAVGNFGRLEVVIENRALPSNPKSSELAALALVRLIENQAEDLVL